MLPLVGTRAGTQEMLDTAVPDTREHKLPLVILPTLLPQSYARLLCLLLSYVVLVTTPMRLMCNSNQIEQSL